MTEIELLFTISILKQEKALYKRLSSVITEGKLLSFSTFSQLIYRMKIYENSLDTGA